MNPKYYTYSPDKIPTHIWGIENETFGLIVMIGFVAVFAGTIIWVTWGDKIATWWRDRPSRKRIKSFVIKVKGSNMTERKFQFATDDVNKLFAGEKLSEIITRRGRKKLNTKNIISITSIPGEDCRYFVIWYKEGV